MVDRNMVDKGMVGKNLVDKALVDQALVDNESSLSPSDLHRPDDRSSGHLRLLSSPPCTVDRACAHSRRSL